MTAPVVRFDAELLVHCADKPLGCNGGVVVTRSTGVNGDGGSIREVVRCVLDRNHDGDHEPPAQRTFDQRPRTQSDTTTTCGLSVSDGAWIDWSPGADDARCASCHGTAIDEQGGHVVTAALALAACVQSPASAVNLAAVPVGQPRVGPWGGDGPDSTLPVRPVSATPAVGSAGALSVRAEASEGADTRPDGCGCGKDAPHDGGAEGRCECCATCTTTATGGSA